MLSLNPGQAHVFELLEVVRECRTWNSKLSLDVHHDHAAGVCRQEKPHDPEPWLRSHGGQHLGIARYISIFGFHDSLAIEKRIGSGHPTLLSRTTVVSASVQSVFRLASYRARCARNPPRVLNKKCRLSWRP